MGFPVACRLNKTEAFTLIEVLIASAILATAIVFIFRSFNVMTTAVKFSQNISLACFLIEDKLWEIEAKEKDKLEIQETASGEELIQGQKFKWEYKLEDIESTGSVKLRQLDFKVLWPENARQEASLDLVTYLSPK